MMIAVPQVWESIRKNILYKVSRAGGLKRTVFNVAVKAKAAAQSRGLTGIVSLTDSIVFNAVRAGTGGRLHTLVSGGSHLSASTQRFLSTTLVQMVLGMCLSEATALAFVMNPAWKTVEAVGGPVPAIEAKLVDRPEEGLRYLSTDSPPRGEIYVRGPALFKGYYKRPDLDSERFAPGGWFKTGDIGQWNPDGTLTLIDRIENHVWVGDRIAVLGRVEAVYKGATFVENGMVMVRNNRLAMVVVAHKDGLPALAQKHRIRPGSLYDLCNNPRVINACLKELNLAARREGLKRHELLKALIIVTDEWSPESGLLTAGHSESFTMNGADSRTTPRHYCRALPRGVR
jgi:long-chain acyl-CoA synthetase